jgi:hypothetical protein
LSEEQRRAIVENQRRYQEMRRELNWGQEVSAVDAAPISHRKGDRGVPFPNPEQVVLAPVPTAEVESIAEEPTATPTPFPTLTPYVRPRRCENNETTRQALSPTAEGEQILSDYLYLAEDLVPLDPQEVFGEKITLYPYGSDQDSATDLRIQMYSVPCLPYRMRLTDRARYYDTGLNALKNYSKDPAGKGQLHPVIQRMLFGDKRSVKRR